MYRTARRSIEGGRDSVLWARGLDDACKKKTEYGREKRDISKRIERKMEMCGTAGDASFLSETRRMFEERGKALHGNKAKKGTLQAAPKKAPLPRACQQRGAGEFLPKRRGEKPGVERGRGLTSSDCLNRGSGGGGGEARPPC